jgi:hypothetical protein
MRKSGWDRPDAIGPDRRHTDTDRSAVCQPPGLHGIAVGTVFAFCQYIHPIPPAVIAVMEPICPPNHFTWSGSYRDRACRPGAKHGPVTSVRPGWNLSFSRTWHARSSVHASTTYCSKIHPKSAKASAARPRSTPRAALPCRMWDDVLYQIEPTIAAVSTLTIVLTVVLMGCAHLLAKASAHRPWPSRRAIIDELTRAARLLHYRIRRLPI